MQAIQVTIPREIPKCPFTQSDVVNAIVGFCQHFFEEENFQAYIESGGRKCPLCRKKIEWYAKIPNYRDSLGNGVGVSPIKLEGEHHIQRHEEAAFLEEGIVKNLFLIERAFTTNHVFTQWCESKDSGAKARIEAQINYDEVDSASKIEAFSKFPALIHKLYDAFDYDDCETIQSFVNKLLKKELNFFAYNLLLREAFISQSYESAQCVMGGRTPSSRVNEERAIDDSEFGKKLRAVVGFVFALSVMVGIGRKIFGCNNS